jgi:hypothetical protein
VECGRQHQLSANPSLRALKSIKGVRHELARLYLELKWGLIEPQIAASWRTVTGNEKVTQVWSGPHGPDSRVL